MLSENLHRGFGGWVENMQNEWNAFVAKRRFLTSSGLLKTQFDLIDYAPLADRYMPKWKNIWEKWALEFQDIYFSEREDDREDIRDMIRKRNFSPRQHIVMAELLWENCEGTDRVTWIPELLLEWQACHRENEREKGDFEFYLRTSDIFPRNVKEVIIGSIITQSEDVTSVVVTVGRSV